MSGGESFDAGHGAVPQAFHAAAITEEPEDLVDLQLPRPVLPDTGTQKTEGNLHQSDSSTRQFDHTPLSKTQTAASQDSALSQIISGNAPDGTEKDDSNAHLDDVQRRLHAAQSVLSDVAEWLRQERRRRKDRHHRKDDAEQDLEALSSQPMSAAEEEHALDRLAKIIARRPSFAKGDQREHIVSKLSRKLSRKESRYLLRRKSTGGTAASDNDAKDENVLVPSAEVYLDNSRTLGYSGGRAAILGPCASTTSVASKRSMKEAEAWVAFKNEVVRLTHTLQLSGWRRLPIESGREIDVVRLSGAMTNAVYVVSPPVEDSTGPIAGSLESTSNRLQPVTSRRPLKKLLLRIYGPQAEHFIDREQELQILRRLAQKQIGPKLLGTFVNGRFEQFFNARPLTAKDIRDAATSVQIAKRMRELHDGIELYPHERKDGPAIWINWDRLKNRCEKVINWLDARVKQTKSSTGRDRGYVCGVEWPVFRKAVRDYREWLDKDSGGRDTIRDELVFAHNDTQYGNLLRLEPSGESPLLLPANSHRQLQVIDFEYAAANLPGLEFANHFTEWCYNYHDPGKSHCLQERKYPTLAEQRNFLKAYIQHVPPIQSQSRTPLFAPTASPSIAPLTGSAASRSISSFYLDSRTPPAQYAQEEEQRDKALEAQIQRLQRQTRLWRVANSAYWVAWGIVQAKIPELEEEERQQQQQQQHGKQEQQHHEHAKQPELDSDPLEGSMEDLALGAREKRPEEGEPADDDDEQEGAEDEDFDYLAYSQERALFFWGDVLQLGIAKREDLPADLLARVKLVDH